MANSNLCFTLIFALYQRKEFSTWKWEHYFFPLSYPCSPGWNRGSSTTLSFSPSLPSLLTLSSSPSLPSLLTLSLILYLHKFGLEIALKLHLDTTIPYVLLLKHTHTHIHTQIQTTHKHTHTHIHTHTLMKS